LATATPVADAWYVATPAQVPVDVRRCSRSGTEPSRVPDDVAAIVVSVFGLPRRTVAVTLVGTLTNTDAAVAGAYVPGDPGYANRNVPARVVILYV